jgi:phospholipid-binding lipoprotein MlaA
MATLYGVLSFRYIDLRSQMLSNDRLLEEGLDRYALLRDAYLQHRNYLLHPEQSDDGDAGTVYVEDDVFGSTNPPIAKKTDSSPPAL